MGLGAPIHWIVVLGVVFLLFGTGRISGLMGDVAKGIKSFKKGMADDEDDAPKSMTKIEAQPAPTVIEAEKQADKQA